MSHRNTSALKDRMRKKLAVKQGPKKFCLTMIVKNESKNMPRLLNTVHSIVDMMSIVDTGSTDNTIEVIHELGKQYNIPTKVHKEPFKNFSYNRTHSVVMAKQSFPEADYYLLSDADFTWEIGSDFEKVMLTEHKYNIEQYNKHIRYWNTRLLSALVDWECVGVTHEYWAEKGVQTTYNGPVRGGKLRTLVINDLEDGGAKEDKFVRDERLLRGGLNDKKTPKDLKSRYKFYLANTLRDTDRYEESTEWYEKRIADGGFPEEVYMSYRKIGDNYQNIASRLKYIGELLGKSDLNENEKEYLIKYNPTSKSLTEIKEETDRMHDKAGQYYLKSFEIRKTRTEGLYAYVKMLRERGKNEEAYKYAIIGRTIKYPEDDLLFVDPKCYDYLFDFELTIVAYYVNGKKEEGREACARLLEREDLPESFRDTVIHNAQFYK